MSARVFKPLPISDVPKMKTVSLFEGKLIYNKNITRVRRALFNPNPEETRRFLNEEFAKMAKSESNKWNFDFVAGRPMNINGQFEWQPIRGKTLREEVARSTKRQTDNQDNSQLYPPIETTAIDAADDDCNLPDEQMSIDLPVEEVIVAKKQSLITGKTTFYLYFVCNTYLTEKKTTKIKLSLLLNHTNPDGSILFIISMKVTVIF